MSKEDLESLATLKTIPLILSEEEWKELMRMIEAPAPKPTHAAKDAYQIYLKTVISSCNTPNDSE